MAKRRKKAGSFERFNNARAEKYELENRLTRRELIPREEIEEEWIRIVSHIKYGFQSLPSRMARALVSIEDPATIYEIIEKDVNRIFESLANLGIQLQGEAEELIEEDEPEEEDEEEQSAEEEQAPKKEKKKPGRKKSGPPTLKEVSEDTEETEENG